MVLFHRKLAEAQARGISDYFVRVYPESDPARYAELIAADDAIEKDRAAHRAVCTCPYCGVDE